MKRILNFLFEVRKEIPKITWLSKDEAIKSTIIVFIIIAISSSVFLLIDILSYKLVNIILKIGI